MIKLHTSTDNQYYFTVCGKNGKVILTSETYKTKQGREKGIKSLERVMAQYWSVKDGIKIKTK